MGDWDKKWEIENNALNIWKTLKNIDIHFFKNVKILKTKCWYLLYFERYHELSKQTLIVRVWLRVLVKNNHISHQNDRVIWLFLWKHCKIYKSDNQTSQISQTSHSSHLSQSLPLSLSSQSLHSTLY